MNWLSVPMILAFGVIVVMDFKSRFVDEDMYDKYNIRTWHTGYFKQRKMLKVLSEEDKIKYKKETKKYGRIQLYAILFIVVYCITIGIVRAKLGWSSK